MTNLAFSGKLIHGGVDVGALLPADASCAHNVRAGSIDQALGQDDPTHGGVDIFHNQCGDAFRNNFIHGFQDTRHAAHTPDRATGFGGFPDWPRWDDITHQKMWIDWIRRAHDGGQRVMVALATNNKTLGDLTGGPGDYATDDRASADLQLQEMRALVARHNDFMEVALSSADLDRIVRADKMAIVLGVEIDNIGNFHRMPGVNQAMIGAELDRLMALGVRYVFPIHVIDNVFGGTAIYEDMFNSSNYREAGHFWDIACSAPGDRVNYHFDPSLDAALRVLATAKLGADPFRNPPTPPACPSGSGHVNARGMTPLGEIALHEMMRRGLLIDVDHMSERTVSRAIDLAKAIPGGYPLNSGHNGYRGDGASENSRTTQQLHDISALHGMAGVGSDGVDAYTWIRNYAQVAYAMGANGEGGVMFGTDLNGLVKAPRPRPGSAVRYDASFPAPRTGSKTWDYNRDGVAHYGMLSDFLKDVRTGPSAAPIVDDMLMRNAQYFFDTWKKAETLRASVR